MCVCVSVCVMCVWMCVWHLLNSIDPTGGPGLAPPRPPLPPRATENLLCCLILNTIYAVFLSIFFVVNRKPYTGSVVSLILARHRHVVIWVRVLKSFFFGVRVLEKKNIDMWSFGCDF